MLKEKRKAPDFLAEYSRHRDPMTAIAFQPGFRISRTDIAVLILGCLAAIASAQIAPWIGLCVAAAVGHFFLFCNIVRMRRILELTWTAVFIAAVSSTVLLQTPGWAISTAIIALATLTTVTLQLRQPSYHGLGWQTINPGLPEWWQARLATRSD